MREEKDIIRGCIEGERWAQQALYELHGKAMWLVCLRYSPTRDDAADLLQEGFLKIFDKIGSFKGETSILGWMSRIFINLAISKYRSSARKPQLISLDQNEIEVEDEGEEEIHTGNHSIAKVMEAMQMLPETYRITLNLYAIEKFSHQEIAEQLGTSIGNSKSNLSRARKMLKDILDKK